MTGGASNVFTRKAVANEMSNRVRKSNICGIQSFGLMPVNSILIPGVRICPQACILDRTTMKNYKNQGKTKLCSSRQSIKAKQN